MRKCECHVLVADGDVNTATVLSRGLTGAGFRVMTVTSGADVLRRCIVQPPDVLILAVDLPDMDGFDVCSYLRCDYADLPLTVIMLGEPADELTRTSFGRMVDFVGGDFFFCKPCDAKVVVELVNELMPEMPLRSTRPTISAFPTSVAWRTGS